MTFKQRFTYKLAHFTFLSKNMSCGRPCLSQCKGDRGFCDCRRFQSRAELEREIQMLEELLEELRVILNEEFVEDIDDPDEIVGEIDDDDLDIM